jgi:outer membrane protein assembly factor BamB
MIGLDKKWLILVVLMLATHALFAPLACAADWPMFGHDPQHTGVAGESVEPPLELLWKFRTDGAVLSSPAISGDTVYIGSGAGYYVYALDAATGVEKWKFKTDGDVWSSPAIYDNTVYIGSGDGYIYALDSATGAEKWKYETGNQISFSSPAISGDTVYIGSGDGYVYALDVVTGEEKWKYKTSGYVSSSPAISGNTIYIGTDYVYALDADTGAEKWKYETGGYVSSSPSVSGNTIYIGSGDGCAYALDATTGNEKWKYETGGIGVSSSPAISDGTVYIGSWNGYAYALDAATGTEKWRYKIGDIIYSSPAVSSNTVYISSRGGYMYALDTTTGTEKWKYEIGHCDSSPAISAGTIYIGSHHYGVYAFSPRSSIYIHSSPPGADMHLNGIYKDTTPTTIPDVSPGSHTIKLTKSGYEDYTTTVYVSAGDAESIYATLTQETGSISVSSAPSGADIYLDGAYKGTTPTTISDASPGSHTLKLEKHSYAEWLTPVHVTSGVTESITAHLTTTDVSPPAIRIDKPAIIEQNNNRLLEEGEKVTITYGANDPSRVASIKILLGGVMLESQNQAGTYTVTTNSLAVGEHTIRVEATDSKSNSGFEELLITVERTGPSVYFGTTRTTIKKGEDAIFTLSAVNPIGNPPMTVQLILKPPSGVSVTSSSFAKAGSGIYTCTQTIESGDNVRSIEVRLTGNEVGTHEIESEVYYQFEGIPKSPTRYETLMLVVDDPDSTPLTPTPKPSPGFAAVIAITGLFAAYLRRRRI